ncbi:MAG: hypothetical protein P8H62_02160 [Henriciella sp.]|nr:hypothetical protein [Henriciella sp.]
MSRSTVGGVAGVVGALIGGFMGFRQAIEIGMQPWQGALILGAVGLILGSAGGYILRTLSALLVYVILLGVLAYFFRDQIELLTGIDPVESAITIFNDCLDLIRGEIAERRVE